MKSLFLVALCATGIGQLSAQNVLFVKSGVTDGNIITVGTETGAAYTTLKEAVAHSIAGDIVKLTEDVAEAGTITHPYGDLCCVVHDRITIDGCGHSLTVTGISGGYSCAIYTKGGTIKNLTVTGGFRVIFSGGSSSDINIDNCVIDAGSTGAYTFNSDAAGPYALNITNSTLKGWTSYTMGYSSSTISNNTFDKCSYLNYGYYRPYIPTVCESCSFTSDVWVDASTPYRVSNNTGNPAGEGYILFNNCSYNGTALTESNVDNLLDHDWNPTNWHWSDGSETQGYLVPAEPMTTNVDGEVTGGVFSGDVDYLNTIVAPGYGAVALGTTPETYQVTPVYYIHYNNNGGTGTMADSYVARTSPTFTVPASTFTNGDWTFAGWNTKADGTGTALAVDATMTLSSDTTLYAQWRGVAKIGDVHYVTLDAAVDAVQANETIEILADSCGITNTKVIPAGVTITGQGKTNTIMTIASTSGSGLTLNNANVTLRDMTIDGSQITSGGYKCLVNVRADGCLITDVVMKKGGQSTWNSSILVTNLNATQTFTVRNSTISGSFRGVLRESCNANIVIDNCDIDAVYPFNIDGGSAGVITVTNSGLHGWTSYSGVESVTFTNCDFSKATSGYDVVAAYVNTTFDNCTMDNNFQIYAQTSGFEFTLEDCEKNGTLITNENFTDFFTDSDVWNKCLTTVNEVSLVSKQAQVTEVLTGATTDKYAKMTKSFEYDGALCGPASDKTLNLNCNDSTLIMKNNGTQIATLTSAGGKYTLEYACEDGSIVSLTNASVAISEGTAFTVTDQTTFFKAADGYFLVETDNGGSYTYSVGTLADKVACIGDGSLGTQYFTTLADAVTAAAAATDTIVILQDIADLPQQTIDKNISINLNNHTLSGSTEKLINIIAGDVTIKNGSITSTAAKMIDHASIGTLNINDCVLSGANTVVYAENGTVNTNNSTLSGANLVMYSTNCVVNAIDCNISSTGTAINNTNGGIFYLENCNVTSPALAINNAGGAGVGGLMKINGGVIQTTSYGNSGTIFVQNGNVDIYGDAKIYAYYRAIEVNTNDAPSRSAVVNFGGYMDGGNLVASGTPSIILRDTTSVPVNPYAINVWYASTINVVGDATITANNQNVTAAIGLTNGGTANITGGTIEAYNDGVLLSNWVYPDGNANTVNVSDSAFIKSTHGESVNNSNTYPSEVEIWGGTFTDDVSGDKCRDGYAAFPLESNPGYFYVAPSYKILLIANYGTEDRDSCFVRQATGSGVIKANPFVHPFALTFSRWNTKADASGNDFNNRATISGLTRDTTLYAIWTGEVAKIDGTPYATLQAAVNAASAMTGDVTIELVDNTSESVLIRQQTGLNITIDGADHTVTGQIIIDGMGGSSNTETLLIENIHFVYDADYIDDKTDAFVIMPNAKDASASWFTLPDHYNYAHHVTVQNCTFNGDGSNNGIVGVKVPSQGAYDVTVDNCTASNMHSLAQFNSTQGVAITNCTATDNVKNGANIVGGGGTITITNNEITTLTGGDQYGIRIKGGSSGDKDVTLADNTVEAPVAIVLANTVPDHTTINVTGGTYIGDIDDSDNGETFNITGGTFSEDVSGEPCAEGYAAFANGTTPETWTVGQYSVKYLANDGTDNYVAVPLTGSFPVSVTIADPFGTTADFIIWNTAADGSGTYYNEDQSVTLTQSLDLYLQHVVAKIGDNYYTTIQAALDAAHNTLTGDVTIELLNNATGYSIVHQKTGLNLTIEGNEHFLAGQIIVDGNARAAGTETLTIQNVKFQDDKTHFCTGTDAFVVIPSTKTTGAPYYTGAYNYAHNITVEHCSFNSTSSSLDVVGIKATSGATCYNLKMNDVTGDKLHSLAQLTATEGALIDNCTATNTGSFVNISGGGAVDTISNCTFTGVDPSDGYAVRENGGSGVEIYLINNTFEANSVLQLGKNSGSDASGHINVISGNYTGDLNNAQSASGTARFVLKGGTYSEPKATVDSWCAEGYMAVANDPDAEHCTVYRIYVASYYANGGTGTMTNDTVLYTNPDITVKECAFTKEGYAFVRWNTKADGTGVDFTPGTDVTLTQDTTFYAQWGRVLNATSGAIYSDLQAAIDAATAGDSIVVLTDLTITQTSNAGVLNVEKSLIINGAKHTVTTSARRGLWVNASNVNLTLRNLDLNCINASEEQVRGIQINGEDDYDNAISNVNLVMDSCRVTTAGYNGKSYAMNFPCSGNNFNVTVKNSYIKGWAAVNSYAHNTHFVFENDTLYGVNQLSTDHWDDFATINLDGGSNAYSCTGSSDVTIDITSSVVIAEKQGTCNQRWIKMEYGARNININVDCNTKFVDGPAAGANDISEKLFISSLDNFTNTYERGSTGAVVLQLNSTQMDALSSENYTLKTVTDGCEKTRVTHSAYYTHNGGNIGEYIDFNAIFTNHSLNADEQIELLEDVTLSNDLYVPFTGNFTIHFTNNSVEHSITQGDYSIALDDDQTCTTDKQVAGLFTAFSGSDIIETDNGDNTYTYSVAPYYTIVYYSNNSADEDDSQVRPYGETVYLKDYTTFTHADSTIYRWNTQADGNGTDYALGAAYSEDSDIELYAVWRLNLGMTSSATDVVCFGQNNGTDTVKIIGGEAPYQIVLSGGALTGNEEITTDQTQYIFTNLKPSTNEYKVWVTDVLAKDTIRAAFTISQPDTLVISSLTVPVTPCPLMGTGTYPVSMTTTGGNGGNVITWGGDVTDADALSSTITPDADDRDREYTVTVTVTDSKNCSATETTTFSVAPVIANDGSAHSNTTMTIENISKMIKDGCDTVIRNFGTPAFAFTNAAITEGILDTIYNNVSTVAPDSVFAAGTTTVITWTAVDTCGHEVTATQEITIAYAPCPSVEDFDHNVYPSVRIGCDCWTAKNLSSTHYSDGREIQNVMHYPVNSRATVGGNLYDWYATMDTTTNGLTDIEAACASPTGTIQGICPEGWHVPTQAELNDMMGSANTEDLMSVGVWIPNVGTNATGFDMYPAGCYNSELDRYERMYVSAYFWILTPPSAVYHACEFGAACSTTEIIPGTLTMGFSVRCVLDKSDE